MQFLFLDKILFIERHRSIRGVKTVSFEEAYLEKPNPPYEKLSPTLMMETLMESMAALVHYSSDFTLHPIVEEVGEIRIFDAVGPGKAIETECHISESGGERFVFTGKATCNGGALVEVKDWAVKLLPLEKFYEIEELKSHFRQMARVAEII